jgi:predicted Fe-S protein YdhL (DUF1289 family)
MPIFPKIQSPCPYVNDLASIMDGDMCRVCKRPVTDLTEMSDQQRIAFIQRCEGDACVTYRIPAAIAAALAFGAAAAPLPAAADERATTVKEVVVAGGRVSLPRGAKVARTNVVVAGDIGPIGKAEPSTPSQPHIDTAKPQPASNYRTAPPKPGQEGR